MKFEIGMIIEEGNTFVVEKLTAKTVTIVEYQHYERFNQREVSRKTLKKQMFANGEVAIYGYKTIESANAR